MPAFSIVSQIPSFDDMMPGEQWGALNAIVAAHAKAIIEALELANTIADANSLDEIVAATPEGAGVMGSTEITKERALAILAMGGHFLTHVNTALAEAGGLTPKQILYKYWQRPAA
ncbi:hypothetical protein EKD04_009690 [Chloroflexales bacterium ZM16-3]|nr:hypothetical protein [Chloroflexales bacterium ZM16-3]